MGRNRSFQEWVEIGKEPGPFIPECQKHSERGTNRARNLLVSFSSFTTWRIGFSTSELIFNISTLLLVTTKKVSGRLVLSKLMYRLIDPTIWSTDSYGKRFLLIVCQAILDICCTLWRYSDIQKQIVWPNMSYLYFHQLWPWTKYLPWTRSRDTIFDALY